MPRLTGVIQPESGWRPDKQGGQLDQGEQEGRKTEQRDTGNTGQSETQRRNQRLDGRRADETDGHAAHGTDHDSDERTALVHVQPGDQTLGKVSKTVSRNQHYAGDEYCEDELQQGQSETRALCERPYPGLLGRWQSTTNETADICHGSGPGIADQVTNQRQTAQPTRRLGTD